MSFARRARKPVHGNPVDWHTAPDAPFTTDAQAAGIVAPPGRVTGAGDQLAVDPAQNSAFRLINRAFAEGGTVRFESGERGARYLVSGVDAAKADRWVEELSLRQANGKRARRCRSVHRSVRGRASAAYKPWTASMDEGWMEWLLDQHGFKYSVITNADIQAGDLGARFDVILIASDRPRSITDGFAKGTVPPRYEGGIGAGGVRGLVLFVNGGGTLVCLNQSADFAIGALHLPVKDVVAGLPRKDFFANGSILEVTTDVAHPVMAGMPEQAKVFVEQSPVFTTLEGFEGVSLAKYAKDGSPLLSGYLLGEKHLQGMSAALDVKHGRGHVVLIGFRPQWRGQPFGTFRVVLNAALYGRAVADQVKATPGFWAAPKAATTTARPGG